MPGKHLFVPDAVLHGRDTAVGEGVRGRRDRRLGVHRLGGDDAEVALRELGCIARRAQPSDHLARAGQPQAVAVDRVDVRLREVVRPDLDVVERRQVRREQRPHRAAADDTDRYCHESSFALISRSIVSCSGTGTPTRCASRTSEPVIMSISVGRCASTSSSIDG